MKKLLLSFTAFAALAATANAQTPTRMALYEEFTGEDCAPCSYANPLLWNLMGQSGNDGTKVQMLSFQEPIPHQGFLYFQTKAISDTRLSYYSVNGTPTGFMNGAITHPWAPSTSYAGAPEDLTQADIDSASTMSTTPFAITFSNVQWASNYSQITATVNVHAVSAYAPAGGNVKLRVALVESINFATAPGITGEGTETEFHNVVRAMYPDVNGTSVASSWAAGIQQNYNVTFTVPPGVDINNHPYIVAWIQNDADKSIAQAARSTALPAANLTADAGIDSTTTFILACGAAGTSTASFTSVLHNYGTSTLTAATIYARINTGLLGFGTWTTHNWTGSLAPGATTTVTYTVSGIPSYGGSGSQYNRVYDSVAVPGDVNTGNNSNYGNVFLQVTPSAFGAFRTGFEATSTSGGYGVIPTGWMDLGGADGSGGIFSDYYTGSSTTQLGHNGSTWALGSILANYNAGYTDYEIMPTYVKPATGKATFEFYYAYAQQTSSSNDALDVVYSTDCGKTWTSIWHKAGANLATGAAATVNPQTGAGLFVPSSNADYQYAGMDITNSVPNNAMMAFQLLTGGGNTLFIDDVQLTNNTESVTNVNAAANVVSLYPNPTKENAVLSITLANNSNVRVDVIDALGRVITTPANSAMAAGVQKINISTAGFATGIYNIKITTDAGTTTERLSVID